MKRLIRQLLSITTRGARYQIGIALALITVIPLLCVAYLAFMEAGDVGTILLHRPLIVTFLLAVVASGYVLISTYPANIVRLRRYLEDMVNGNMPDKVDLLKGMADIPAIERSLKLIVEQLSVRVSRMEDERQRIEWLLSRNVTPSFWKQERNSLRIAPGEGAGGASSSIVLQSVGEDMLVDIIGDIVELLETSAAVYEKDGQCVLSVVLSDWCRFLDESGRTRVPRCGGAPPGGGSCALCEASWSQLARQAIESGEPVDLACEGGIRLYGAPIMAGKRTVGALGFGYGDPPRDEETLERIAARYGVSVEDLRRKAASYESRPAFIVSVAKNRLLTVVHLIGAIIERREAEAVLRQSEEELRRHRAHLEELVEERAAELRQTNAQLTQEVEERRKAERLKDEFVSVVSHELRTPLAITREGIALMRDGIPGPLTEKQGKVLATLENNIDRLSRIINDLLDISKIEAGRMSLIRERANLAALVRQAVALLDPLAKKKGVQLVADLPSEDIGVYGDVDRIMQVLTNLIDNAIKFTVQGSVRVSASCRGGEVDCCVADTGIGLAESDIPNLFKKFVQIGRKPGAGHKGTGLGLAIAKNIVELHRGRIAVESAPGKGTTFRFVLPAYSEEEVLLAQMADRLAVVKQKVGNLSVFVVRITFPEGQGGEDRWVRQLIVESNALVRGSDLALSRGPGEVLVLAEVDPALIPAVCERWRRQIAKDFAQLAGVCGVKANMGHASFPADGTTVEELLRKAEIGLANQG